MLIWIVQLRSTGESWHTYACANLQAVKRSLEGHCITKMVFGQFDGDFTEWESPSDKSQTASVSRVHLVE